NQAIGQMDQVTQQNAALVEEASAAAESMQEQAGKLAQVVAVFRLQGGQGAQQAAAPAARPATKTAVRQLAAKPVAKAGGTVPARKSAVPAGSTTATGDWEEF
ncbi:MAG: methyl-accepting chemotaxis protein, partial [Burkholderiaceae bacterium]